MDIKEAISWQEAFKKTYKGTPKEVDVACDMAVSALEKQVAKKIVHNPEAGREADWTCPACKWTCSPYARHCQNCGQALYNGEYGKD